MARGKAVEVYNVSKSFGTYQALDQVSFTIQENEFFTLLGPSGCGKTTLLRMIAGFESPSEGAILLDGQQIETLPPHRRRVNTVFQSYALFPHMTLAQNIAFGLENLGWDRRRRRDRVAEMLELVHMTPFAGRRPAQLSGGQRQRIALARALAPEPQVLLLDEPLSALDLKLRQAMRDELKSLQKKTGITFIFVTHDQEEALDMSDRICVLGQGRIQQIGTPSEIYEDPENRFVADFIGETNFLEAEVLELAGGMARIRTPFGLEITAPQKGLAGPGPATLSLRPEKIGMESQAEGHLLQGTVTGRNYMGGFTHYTVDVAGQSLRVSRRNALSHAEGHAPGQPVSLGFRADSVRVLAQ
ncbi:ABC transporter ATP-binding protein [Mangrovicoccus algicola]|uniref:Spermidine/putrescine import ATP-binding protein PotA n=1 Tax=Mangrovicoccus algicola TaxID=2771008 RepID=A0A8J6ZAQ6_9RHOB|nr:ABC transporter ATP-binding protein [Mangrovicoccus algicola]MBE3639296.1 ABC transporter ATP-binding protein [Mangrovicoccus algicola]